MSEDKNTSAATEEQMRKLHNSVAQSYQNLIDRYSQGEVLDTNGEIKACPASLLAAAAKFLNDNGQNRPTRVVDVDDDPLNDQLPDLSYLDKYIDPQERSGEQ